MKTVVCVVSLALSSTTLIATSAAGVGSNDAGSQDNRALRDGQHDFDFDFGTWKTHSSRLLHPLTGSTTWVDMDGITVVSKVWGGRANLAEFKADGPAGHLELLSLRTYIPAAHQWSLAFATPNVGVLGIPSVGEFKNGRGVFYDQEPINGKSVLVRFSIWGITANTAQSEQAFSNDGGKTWEVNWINRYTRERTSDAPPAPSPGEGAMRDGSGENLVNNLKLVEIVSKIASEAGYTPAQVALALTVRHPARSRSRGERVPAAWMATIDA